MMNKKPTRKYAAGGMTAQKDMFNAALQMGKPKPASATRSAQADKVNAANMAAMQKANPASKPSAATQKAVAAPVQKAVATASSNKPSDAEVAKIKAALGGAKPRSAPATAAKTSGGPSAAELAKMKASNYTKPKARPAPATQKPTPMGASPVKPDLTLKQKAQNLKGARQQFREDRKSGALKENVQAQKKDMRAALKSDAVPKEDRKSLREQIKNTNVKSVAQGVRSNFQENRKAIQAERAANKARRQTAKAMGSVAGSLIKKTTKGKK
jgi:hypothetical protein